MSFLDPGGVDFGTQKLVEKVEGNKVEKMLPKGPLPIIGNSLSGPPGSLGGVRGGKPPQEGMNN